MFVYLPNSDLTNLCFRSCHFKYDFSASSSWVSFGSSIPREFLSVIPPATPPDLSVLLDLLGLLRSAALLFSGSTVPIHKDYSLWDLAPVSLCVLFFEL